MDNNGPEYHKNVRENSATVQTYFNRNKLSELDEEVINQIYCSCDVKNDNTVSVSKLLEFISPFVADSSLDLLPLKNALDPTDTNQDVNRKTFSEAFTSWIFEFNQRNVLDKSESTEEYFNASSSDVPQPEHNRCFLEDHISQLKFQNCQLTVQLDLVQNQLGTSEDDNKLLSTENAIVKNKLLKLQELNNDLKVDQKHIEKNEQESTKLKADIKALKSLSALQVKTILELNKNLETKELKNEQLESDVTSLNKNIRKKKTIISELQQEVKNKEDSISVLNDIKDALDVKVNELEDLLKHYKEENVYVRSENAKLKQQCQDNTAQLLFLKPENQKNFQKVLSKQNSETSLNNNSHKDAIWKFTVTNVTTCNSLEKELSQAHKELLINQYHSVINQQKLTIEALVEKIKVNLITTKKATSHRPPTIDLSSLELKIIDLEAESNRKYIRIVDLMEQKQQLQKQLNADHEQYCQENQTLKEENKKLKTENDQLQLIIFDLNNKRCELENQNENLQIVANKCGVLEDTLKKLAENNKTTSKELNQTHTKNVELEKELDYLRNVYEECNKENVEFKEKVTKLEEKCNIQCLQEKKSIGLQVDAFLDEVTANGLVTYRLSDKSEQLFKKEKQVKILEKMIDYQNLELEALRSDNKRHVDQIYELKGNGDKLAKQIEELHSQLDVFKNTKETLLSEVEFLNKLNGSLQVDLQNFNDNYDTFQAGFCSIEEYNFLVNENKLIGLERDRLIKENEESKKKNTKVEDQILRLIKNIDDLSFNVVEVKAHLQNYKLIIRKLRQQLKNHTRTTYTTLEEGYLKKISKLEDKNVSLQIQQHDLQEEFVLTKTNYVILTKEKVNWTLEKKELNDAKEKLLLELEENLKEKKQIEIQLRKKTQMVCEHCTKLHREKEELHKHIKDLQYEIGLLEKEIYAPKKRNYENAQDQLQKLKMNLEIANELLQHEKQNNEMFKEQNTKLLSEINEIKNENLQEKLTIESKYKKGIENLKKEIEDLQVEKISLHASNSNIEQELESATKKNENLQNKVADLFGQNLSLDKKLDEAFLELKKKTCMSVKLQADLREEEVLLELFHQKSILFQQNIDAMYNQKSDLEKKLQKALNDLQKSENKYLSIRKLLVDSQSHVSGDFQNTLQAKESDEKIVNLEFTLKRCQEELSNVKLKCAESVLSFNSLKKRMELTVKKNRNRLNNSLLGLVSNWQEMLQKVIDVQLMLDTLSSNDSESVEELDENIFKLENEIHLTVQCLNSLSTFKLAVKSHDEFHLLHNSKFIKKVTLKSTTTKIENVLMDSEENLISPTCNDCVEICDVKKSENSNV